MRRGAGPIGFALCLAALLLGGCGKTPSRSGTAAPATRPTPGARPLRDVVYERTEARRRRGEYLTEGVLQCFLCHTERQWKAPGAPPLAGRKGSGRVWKEVPGLVAPNITPDEKTGAGTWTDDMLARSIREGIGHDGRVLHPQMWYGSFRSLSDEDLASVIVFLRSIPPVSNELPATKLSRRRPVPEPLIEPVPHRVASDPVKRGAYLVRIADCEGCHTPWEAPKVPGLYAGGNLIELWGLRVFSPNLTADPTGIPYYDEALFREVMRTGRVRARELSPLMPWVVFGRMTDANLDDIFAYLRARRPVRHSLDNTEPPTACVVCGQEHGLGERNVPKSIDAVPLDPVVARAYAGEYRFEDGFFFTLIVSGENLFVRFAEEEGQTEFFPNAEGEFQSYEAPDVFRFVKDGSGRVVGLLANVDDLAKKRL